MAGLNKKRPVFASPYLQKAMEKLSKACLMDLCIDLLRRCVDDGADSSEGDLLLALVEEYLPVVLQHRGDRLNPRKLLDIFYEHAGLLSRIKESGRAPTGRTLSVATLISANMVEENGDELVLTKEGEAYLESHQHLLNTERVSSSVP
jgi:hypothetical protein